MIVNHTDLETKKREEITCQGRDSNGNQRGLRMRPQFVLMCVAVTATIINCVVRKSLLTCPYNIFDTLKFFVTTCLNLGCVTMSDMWHTLHGK